MRRISGSSTALPSRHLLAEHPHNCLWVTVNDGQQDAGGAIWNTASLFPFLHGTRVETESVRKFLATQLHALPYRKNMLCRRIVDNAARQIYFAAHVGKNLAQGRLYLLTRLGSFRRHRFLSSFLIAATSRDRALLSAAVRSSRSAFA